MTDTPAGERIAGEPGGERIAKRLARAGLCSRREAERWILEGRVAVDGVVLKTPAMTVTGSSLITVDGKPLAAAERARLWRFNKPRDMTCAASARVTSLLPAPAPVPATATARPAGTRPGTELPTSRLPARSRGNIYDVLPKELPRVMPAGALDASAEGLMLLTNDGGLKRHLELPATGWSRRYRVRVYGSIDEAKLKSLSRGVNIAGVDYGPIDAKLELRKGANAWLIVALTEGPNRDVRKVIEHLGLSPSRLIRIAYGPFQLGNLAPGEVAEVPGKVIREQIGGIFAGPKTGQVRTAQAGMGTAKTEPAKPAPHKPGRGFKARPKAGRGPVAPKPASGFRAGPKAGHGPGGKPRHPGKSEAGKFGAGKSGGGKFGGKPAGGRPLHLGKPTGSKPGSGKLAGGRPHRPSKPTGGKRMFGKRRPGK